ncbi:MAG: hypothetical protein ABI811_03505 [Acidobacteriota bacterium]
METQKRLSAAFASYAAKSAEATPPIGIEQAVLAEFDRVTRARQKTRQQKTTRWILAASAAAAAVLAVWAMLPGTSTPTPVSNPPVVAESDFVPIPYVTALAPYERIEVVRMNVPVAALIAAGLPFQGDPGAQATADVVVGQDGRARAVRLISISSLN